MNGSVTWNRRPGLNQHRPKQAWQRCRRCQQTFIPPQLRLFPCHRGCRSLRILKHGSDSQEGGWRKGESFLRGLTVVPRGHIWADAIEIPICPALETVFGNAWHIAAGSMIAFGCGSFGNSFVMTKMKIATKKKIVNFLKRKEQKDYYDWITGFNPFRLS